MLEGSGLGKKNGDRGDVRAWDLAYSSESPSGTVWIEATAGAIPIVDELTFSRSTSAPASKLLCQQP